MTRNKDLLNVDDALILDIRRMIEEARSVVASTVNAALTTLYWQVGRRINEEMLKGERAEYGASILPTLSAKLAPLHGEGFGERNLARMVQFAETFPNEEIVATLSQQLSWSHFRELLSLEKSGIRVAEYLTELPPRDVLERKLHTAFEHARQRMETLIEKQEVEPTS